MIQQLLEFIEKHYFDIPRKKIIKIISRRLEEIREIDNSSIILGYSPEKILEGFLIKLAEFYDYKLSPNFLEKYEKELPHSPSYPCYTKRAVEPPAERRWPRWKKFSPHFLSPL